MGVNRNFGISVCFAQIESQWCAEEKYSRQRHQYRRVIHGELAVPEAHGPSFQTDGLGSNLTIDDYHVIVCKVAPRRYHLQSLYLEPSMADMLDALAVRTRVPKAVLLREAVADLLRKHRGATSGERRQSKGRRT